MRGVLLEVPESILADRRRLGVDRFDEMWAGELHMVPPPSEEHQRIGLRLVLLLAPLAEDAGLSLRYETGLFDPDAEDPSDYRVPDLVVFGESRRSARGVEGAATLVVEIRSTGDETLGKLPFFERVGVEEVLVVDRDTKAVRHWTRDGERLVEDDSAPGWIGLGCLPVRFGAEGGQLLVEDRLGIRPV
ncbi:MAG: Uma2 family endonuclease [Acidimicrobiales bacterium]